MSLLVDVGGAWTAMGKLNQVTTRAGKSCPLKSCWGWTLESTVMRLGLPRAPREQALGEWPSASSESLPVVAVLGRQLLYFHLLFWTLWAPSPPVQPGGSLFINDHLGVTSVVFISHRIP